MTKDEAHLAQEPVAWMGYEGGHKILTRQRQIADAYPELYTVALYPHPQRTWVDLTDEDLEFWTNELGQGELGRGVIRAVADHLKEKNK